MRGFESPIFDVIYNRKTLNFIFTFPDETINYRIRILQKLLIKATQAGAMEKYWDNERFQNLDSASNGEVSPSPNS